MLKLRADISPLENDVGHEQALWRDKIFNEDSIEGLRRVPDNCAHLILSDIPYGIGAEDWDVLHDNTNSAYLGASPAQEKAGKVFKSRGKPINGWSEADRLIPKQYYDWCSTWASDWLRVVKPGGSAIVFAGRRYAHRCVAALEDAGFTFKDMLAWERDRAVHRAQRLSIVFRRRGNVSAADEWSGWRVGNLRPSFEPILWFTKPYKIGTTIADNVLTHGVGAYNQEAFERYSSGAENIIRAGFRARESGLHPTQKPLNLMAALIELTTQKGQLVLDPFAGSGTTGVAAKGLGRNYLMFERSRDFYETAQGRFRQSLLDL
ncbi:MAG: site-specific DNA-methyltransferase [Phenylobacterium zucineum]|nr:MAG: site-specific DNA-methyltransferase [Phenylobacterium zucineum]